MKSILRSRWGESVRIIWAIAAKDIVDAIKNKTTISIMLGIGMVMLSSQALPFLLRIKPTPTAVIYDVGASGLIDELAKMKDLRLREVTSQGMMEKILTESSETQLGLVFPADLRQNVQTEGQMDIDGFAAYWAKSSDVIKLVEFFEGQLGELVGVPVHIDYTDNRVYPNPDSDGQLTMISLTLVLAINIIGVFLVPYLMLEEKEKHTMEALLVSPASYGQMVVGKAIAGSFYCLTAAAVVFALNLSMFNQWGIAFLAVICGSLFAVAVGLLLGTIFENPGTLNLWVSLVILSLLASVFLKQFVGSSWPPIVKALVAWFPTVAMSNVIQVSFSNLASLNILLPNLGIMLGAAILLLSVVVWKVRRMDR
ncbi:MAG: ABC transporter permease [Anaerolineaceae bacterium]|nr:MAG: ABC transporter permease [Anaerolineaceae bacterium]